ncbi:hypothetical protein B0T18DRAFT_155553 [Schizothecium vesticola]|uniref:Uncharacterized protein n=1 Tax=Schizothecium vesticola TaxID=314040 RepID=A0AA40K5U4_9PEZI|nr:hypothetical protein B0T18DRAFT_155553 [Schizothecium vesticola]
MSVRLLGRALAKTPTPIPTFPQAMPPKRLHTSQNTKPALSAQHDATGSLVDMMAIGNGHGYVQPSRQWRCKMSAQCPTTYHRTHPPPTPKSCVGSVPTPKTSFCRQDFGGRTAAPETAVVGNDAAGAAFCRDASRHMASPSHLPPPLGVSTRSSHFTALATDPTDTLGPSYTSDGEGVVGVCCPGPPEYPLWTWTVDTGIVSSLDASRTGHGGLSSLQQPTQIYCTTANHHGPARRDEGSRARSRIREPPHQPTKLQQNVLGRRSFGAETCPGDRCSCRWVARTSGWGPVEDHFLD